MKTHTKTVHSPEDILKELRALVAEAEAMVDNTLDSSDDVVAGLRARYEDAQERIASAYGTAKKRVVAGVSSADDAIRESPYKSIGVAVGAGVLMGVLMAVLLGRRSSN